MAVGVAVVLGVGVAVGTGVTVGVGVKVGVGVSVGVETARDLSALLSVFSGDGVCTGAPVMLSPKTDASVCVSALARNPPESVVIKKQTHPQRMETMRCFR